jgi:hypothetical protein
MGVSVGGIGVSVGGTAVGLGSTVGVGTSEVGEGTTAGTLELQALVNTSKITSKSRCFLMIDFSIVLKYNAE